MEILGGPRRKTTSNTEEAVYLQSTLDFQFSSPHTSHNRLCLSGAALNHRGVALKIMQNNLLSFAAKNGTTSDRTNILFAYHLVVNCKKKVLFIIPPTLIRLIQSTCEGHSTLLNPDHTRWSIDGELVMLLLLLLIRVRRLYPLPSPPRLMHHLIVHPIIRAEFNGPLLLRWEPTQPGRQQVDSIPPLPRESPAQLSPSPEDVNRSLEMPFGKSDLIQMNGKCSFHIKQFVILRHPTLTTIITITPPARHLSINDTAR